MSIVTMPPTPFPLRLGHWIEIHGLPRDLTPRDVERVVRWLRTLPCPGSAVEVCSCRSGAAHPGFDCPACGKRIPEREIEASERMHSLSDAENVAEVIRGARAQR